MLDQTQQSTKWFQTLALLTGSGPSEIYYATKEIRGTGCCKTLHGDTLIHPVSLNSIQSLQISEDPASSWFLRKWVLLRHRVPRREQVPWRDRAFNTCVITLIKHHFPPLVPWCKVHGSPLCYVYFLGWIDYFGLIFRDSYPCSFWFVCKFSFLGGMQEILFEYLYYTIVRYCTYILSDLYTCTCLSICKLCNRERFNI